MYTVSFFSVASYVPSFPAISSTVCVPSFSANLNFKSAGISLPSGNITFPVTFAKVIPSAVISWFMSDAPLATSTSAPSGIVTPYVSSLKVIPYFAPVYNSASYVLSLLISVSMTNFDARSVFSVNITLRPPGAPDGNVTEPDILITGIGSTLIIPR